MNSILNFLYGGLIVLPFAFVGAVVGALIGTAIGLLGGHWIVGAIAGAVIGAICVGRLVIGFLNTANPQ
jgi:outer membrane lipoprotein SlyB